MDPSELPSGARPIPAGGLDIVSEEAEIKPIPAGGLNLIEAPAGGFDLISEPTVAKPIRSIPAGGLNIVSVEKDDPLDRPLTETYPTLGKVREALSFDWIREGAAGQLDRYLPAAGVAQESDKSLPQGGAEWHETIKHAERTRGIPLHALRAETGWQAPLRGAGQLGANVAAGLAGILASPITLGAEVFSMAGREMGEFAGWLFVNEVLGLDENAEHMPGKYSSSAAIRRAVESGHLSWDAQARRFVSRGKEGAKVFVQSLSPAATAAILAKDGERLRAFGDSFYAYPIENLAGPLLLSKAGLKIGGKPVSVSVSKGYIKRAGAAADEIRVPLKNIRGKDQKLNPIGIVAHDWVHPSLRPILFDADHPERIYAAELFQESHKKRGKRTPKAIEEYKANEAEFRSLLEDVRKAARDDGVELSDAAVLRALENKIPVPNSKRFEMAKRDVHETIMSSPEVLAQGERMKGLLLEAGLDESTASFWMGYTDRALFDFELARRGGGPVRREALELGGAMQRLPRNEPDVYRAIADGLDDMRQKGRLEEFAEKVLVPRASQLRTSIFQDASSRAYKWAREGVDLGDIKWKFRDESQMRDTASLAYSQAASDIRKTGRNYRLQISDWGQVRRTQLFDSWQRAIRFFPKEDTAGQNMIMAALLDDPVVRIVSRENAGPVERLIQNESSPGGRLHKFRQVIRQIQYDVVEAMGASPFVVADNLDSYVSRAFRDMLDAQLYVGEELSIEAARSIHSHPDFMRKKKVGVSRPDIFPDELFGKKRPAGKEDRFVSKRSFRSPRFRRKISEMKSDAWFSYLAEEGILDIGNAAEGTVSILSALSDRMSQWKHVYDHLEKANLARVDKPTGKAGAGWVQVMTTRDVPGKKASMSDPYNFMFGTLAGKWVAPEVARQLALTRNYWKRSMPALLMFKLFHTALNPIGYHVRNELGDTANLTWASGISPMSKKGARARKSAIIDLNRYRDKKIRSKDMIEAESLDVIQPDRADTFVMGEPSASKIQLLNVTESIIKEAYGSAKDPIKANENVARAMLSTLMFHTVPSWVKGTHKIGKTTMRLPAAFREAVAQMWKEHQSGWVGNLENPSTAIGAYAAESLAQMEKGKGSVASRWEGLQAGLDHIVKEVEQTALVRWTVGQENKRRLMAYKLARHEMNMSPADAARFVKNTLHDYGDRPAAQAALQGSTIGQIIAPPFLTYTVKQTAFGARRVFNDPRHFTFSVMHDALKAMELDRHSDTDRLAKWRFAVLSGYGSNNLLLPSSAEMGRALADIGMARPLVDAVKGVVRDEDGNVSSMNDMTMVLPLRDIANLNAALTNFLPGADPMVQMARTNPFINAFGVILDENAKNQATGRLADPNSINAWEPKLEKIKQLFFIFAPFKSMESIVRHRAVPGMARIAALAAGDDPKSWPSRYDPKTGNPIHPVEALRFVMPASPIMPLDRLHLITRLKQGYDAKTRRARILGSQYKRKYNIFDPDGAKVIEKAELNLYFRVQQELLNFTGQLIPNSVNRSMYRDLRKAWKGALKELEDRGAVDIESSVPDSLRDTVGPLLESAQEVTR